MTQVRDQQWLEGRLVAVWNRGFSDLVPENQIVIAYGKRARTRLGSIRMSKDKTVSKILINRLFQEESVPVEVVDLTIAHELTHYVHGFNSPLEQKFRTPHAGGVVTKELKKRGFGREYAFQKKWLKDHWTAFTKAHLGPRKRRRVRRRRRSVGLRLVRHLLR